MVFSLSWLIFVVNKLFSNEILSFVVTLISHRSLKVLVELILVGNLKSWTLTFQKKFFICFNDSPSKMMKNAFNFILKAFFILKIFKFLSWLFRHVEKTAWLERQGQFPNWWRYNLVSKELQNIYCSISHELKAIRQRNLVS